MGKVLAPHAPVTRDDNLLSSLQKTWLQCYLFSLLFFLFLWCRQGYCPCSSNVSSGAMKNSDLRSSLSLNICVLNWFLCFWKNHFSCEQKCHLRRWTLKQCFKFWKAKRIIKALDLGMIFCDIWKIEVSYELVLSWFCLLAFNLFKRLLT